MAPLSVDEECVTFWGAGKTGVVLWVNAPRSVMEGQEDLHADQNRSFASPTLGIRLFMAGWFLVCFCQFGWGQRWIDVDGYKMALRYEAGNPAPARRLNPHHEVVIFGALKGGATAYPQVLLEDKTGKGTRMLINSKQHAVYLGHPALAFDVPLVAVGHYKVSLLHKDGPKEVGTMTIPPFRCYFNRRGDARQASNLERIVPHVDLPTVMARYIDRAQKTIDIAMSDFDHPGYVGAIIRAHQRGVRVRFISDERAQKGEPKSRARLKKAGVPFITNERDLKVPTTMHHKLMIVDDRCVLVGHAKGNIAHTRVNQSFVSIIGRPLAAIYLDEFNHMWGGTGLESPKANRKFAMNKTLPKHRFCEVQGLDRKIRIDVGFAPAKVPTGSADSRPLNILMAAMIARAQSDIGFLASGFGDTDVGKVIREAVEKRGLKFYGVQGDPDWHLDHNNLVKQFQGLGKKGWNPPADVVGTFDMDEEGVWVNVHNRVMVLDVLGKDTNPVAMFSSGAWRMGLIKADDSMVCIHDRDVAEQLLQHIGGTRIRSFAALAHRNVVPKADAKDGVLRIPAAEVIPLYGGKVQRNDQGGVALTLHKSALVFGDRTGFILPNAVAAMPAPDGDQLMLPASAFAELGIYVLAKGDRLVCLGPKDVEVPLASSSAAFAAAKQVNKLREGESHGAGIVFSDAADKDASAEHHGGIRPEGGFAQAENNGLAVLGDSLPRFVVEADANRPILANPEVALALDQAIAGVNSRFPLKDPFVVVDGAGLFGSRARNKAREGWRSRRGAGLVLRVPESADAMGGSTIVRELLSEFMKQGITRIGIDKSLIGKLDAEEFLLAGQKGTWMSAGRPGLFKSKDRKTFVYISNIGKRQVELEQSMWDFRGNTGEKDQ